MKVLMLRATKEAVYQGYIGELENSLKAEQEFVGGCIEVLRLTNNTVAVFNEEGKILSLPFNRFLVDERHEVYDVILGNIFCCGVDEEGGFCDIDESEIPIVIDRLRPACFNVVYPESVLPVYKGAKFDKKLYYSYRYPAGTIIELTAPIDDPYNPKPVGARFKVNSIDDAFQLHGSWLPPYSGCLAVDIEHDSFVIV